MFDHNEQQVSGDEPKSESESQSHSACNADAKCEQPAANDQASSCGGGSSGSYESCSCESEFTGSASSTDLVFSRPSMTPYTEMVFAEQSGAGSFAPIAADINAGQRTALWESLVQSQRPPLWDALVQSQRPSLWASLVESQRVHVATPRLQEIVAKKDMQWTLVDLTAAACDKPGCDPQTCDEEDCGTTNAYDRGELEQPEYATAGYAPALALNTEEPAPAPLAFVPAAAKAVKAKKAAAKTAKTVKKTKTPKAAGKKAAAKKPAAKKTVKKAAAKKPAKKATTARSKKAAAKTSLPMPTPSSDPHFPRVQAA